MEEKAAESNHLHEQSHDFEANLPDDNSILASPEADAAAEAASQSLFESLLVATAALVAFAHSANDIANSVCFEYATTQSLDVNYHAPFWLFLVAGVVLCLGLLTLGFVVMRTIGEKITKLQPMAGFCAQLAGSVVVITATLIGLPVSTTHVIVGAVTGVGVSVDGIRAISLGTIGKILIGWLVTICIGAGLTLAFYAPLRLTIVVNATITNATID